MYSLLENNSDLTQELVEQKFDGNLFRWSTWRRWRTMRSLETPDTLTTRSVLNSDRAEQFRRRFPRYARMSALSSATEPASPERRAVHVFDRTNTYWHFRWIDPVHHELPGNPCLHRGVVFSAVDRGPVAFC